MSPRTMVTATEYLSTLVILVVLLAAIFEQRTVAALVAAVVGIIAHAPLFFDLGWGPAAAMLAELALALVLGVVALIHSRRWPILALFPALPVLSLGILVLLLLGIITAEDKLPGTQISLISLSVIITASAPAFLVAASVFFVGAFIERRPEEARKT